jgi:hypothetical protein
MNHLGDTNKMVSETPRTNQVSIRPQYGDEWDWCRADFARQLERELNAANDRIKRLEEDSERLNWLLDRGLAWRDCYDDFWKEGEWLYASQSALETIDKAKEAKP